jgi:hypothetical protein
MEDGPHTLALAGDVLIVISSRLPHLTPLVDGIKDRPGSNVTVWIQTTRKARGRQNGLDLFVVIDPSRLRHLVRLSLSVRTTTESGLVLVFFFFDIQSSGT